MIFDGRGEAKRLREELMVSGKLNGKSLLILQADGSGEESTYVRLKREMGERLNIRVKVKVLRDKEEVREILEGEIEESGVLVQLPIFGANREETQAILDLIPENKDVDGLRSDSRFLPAVVLAVGKVIKYALEKENLRFTSVAVVGAKGMVGKRLVAWLLTGGFEVDGFDLGDDLRKLVNYDVVIGATGRGGLIADDLVKDGVIAVDLGYPMGDFVFEKVREKASLITPVPGGVGPLTVVCLYENLAGA